MSGASVIVMPKLRTPKFRSAAAGCATALAIGVLASGCTGRTGPVEVPTQNDVTQTLAEPTPDDAVQWADGVIPDNAVGGTRYVTREAGVLEPGAEPVVVLAGDAGSSSVTLACATRPESALSYAVVVSGAAVDEGTTECPRPGDPAQPHTIAGVPAGASVMLSAERSGLFVYAVTPETDPAS